MANIVHERGAILQIFLISLAHIFVLRIHLNTKILLSTCFCTLGSLECIYFDRIDGILNQAWHTSHSSSPVAISYAGAWYLPCPNQLWGTFLPIASPPAIMSLRAPPLNATLLLCSANWNPALWTSDGIGTFPESPEDSWAGGAGGCHSPTCCCCICFRFFCVCMREREKLIQTYAVGFLRIVKMNSMRETRRPETQYDEFHSDRYVLLKQVSNNFFLLEFCVQWRDFLFLNSFSSLFLLLFFFGIVNTHKDLHFCFSQMMNCPIQDTKFLLRVSTSLKITKFKN